MSLWKATVSLTARTKRLRAPQELTDERSSKDRVAAELKLEIERLSGAKAAIEAAQSAVAAKDTQLEAVYQQLKVSLGLW